MEYKNVYVVSIEDVVHHYIKDSIKDGVFFVIVGANNGETKDFLSGYLTNDSVSGILIEPVQKLFNQLKRKFSPNQKLIFENCAIYGKKCKKTLYVLEGDSLLPGWTEGLGSFSKSTILYHRNQVEDIDKYVVPELVNCVTFNGLMEKYNPDTINILQIDCEGYDYEILLSIDFEIWRPEIIIIEFLHLSHYQYYAMINFLESLQYAVNRNFDSFDLIAVDKKII